ncbi:MAG: glycosyltransferase family 9 protein [Melioribacteraceae bacterium]|nr:glycosyltransferase family 9 protein [Melioribacteraceae bacterium]
MNLSKIKKILIIRLSSLGDVLLTTPLIRTLKSSYPNIKIDFIVRKEFESTLKYNPNINNLIALERNYKKETVRSQIIKENYDLIIDLQNNIRSRYLTRSLSFKTVRYRKPYLNRILLVKLKINRFKEVIPIPVRYANSLSNFELDQKGLELFIPDEEKSEINDDNFIGLCPGSRHFTKMWPKEYYIELGNQLIKNNYKVALFGGKDDMAICNDISAKLNGALNLSNDNDLIKLAVNMRNCKAIVCNDSGLMHTALALNIPVISIFGSTVKEFGFFPYKGKNIVLENNLLSCRPCSHIGLDKCPQKHMDCLNKITPITALEAVKNIVNKI